MNEDPSDDGITRGCQVHDHRGARGSKVFQQGTARLVLLALLLSVMMVLGGRGAAVQAAPEPGVVETKFTVTCGSAPDALQGNWVGLQPVDFSSEPYVKVADKTPVVLTFPRTDVKKAFAYRVRVEYRGWLLQYGDEKLLAPTTDTDFPPLSLALTGPNWYGVVGLLVLIVAVPVVGLKLARRGKK